MFYFSDKIAARSIPQKFARRGVAARHFFLLVRRTQSIRN